MSTAKNVVVKFLKSWRGYNTGESAGFGEDVARTLVDGDVAEYADAKGRAKAKSEKPAGKGDKPGSRADTGSADSGAGGASGEGDANGAGGGSQISADQGGDERP